VEIYIEEVKNTDPKIRDLWASTSSIPTLLTCNATYCKIPIMYSNEHKIESLLCNNTVDSRNIIGVIDGDNKFTIVEADKEN
jgi:hypothetical protein